MGSNIPDERIYSPFRPQKFSVRRGETQRAIRFERFWEHVRLFDLILSCNGDFELLWEKLSGVGICKSRVAVFAAILNACPDCLIKVLAIAFKPVAIFSRSQVKTSEKYSSCR
jgi:hypothetical protein